MLSDAQKESIQTAIADSGQQLAGTVLNIFDPELVKYAAYIYVKMKSTTYDKTYIEDKIHSLIGEFMCDVTSDTLIPKSDIIHLLKEEIDSIDSVDIYFISERNETALINGTYTEKTYTFDDTLKTYTIEETEYAVTSDPGLGLDSHGNIYVNSDYQFPVLMGGWQYISSASGQERQYATVSDPVIIVFE